MNNASLELGGTNWAEKDASLLGYTVSDDSGRFFPQEFTFSRGSNLAATRIGKTGLIEKGRENLLKYSNQFDTTWTVAGSTITDGQSGYDGSNNAWLLSKSSASGNLGQNTTSNGVTTFSVYAKANASLYLRLIIFNGTFAANGAAYFDLQNGALGTTNAIDSNIESVGNGWYRCSVSFNTSNQRVYIYPAEANSTTGTTGSIYIQDAQLEQGLAASPYIPTTTTTAQAGVLENTPRLNYTTGVADPYLLLEPSRSNLVVNSEYINNSASGWSTFFDTNITNNAATSPDGANNATEVACPIGGSARIDCVNNGLAVGTYTYTFYAKGNVSSLYLNAYEDATGTTLSSTSISTLINDSNWSRIDVTFTTTAISTIRMIINSLLSGESFYIYGAQLEEGSYATSYIPTYSVSATRAADSCTSAVNATTFNDSEGTFFIEFAADFNIYNSGLADRGISISNGTNTNAVKIFQAASLNNRIAYDLDTTSGSNQVFNISTTFSDITDFNKVAFTYKQNEFKIFANGTQQGATDTSGSVFSSGTLDRVSFSFGQLGVNPFYGKIKQVLYFHTALTDTELATLTTP